MSCIIEEEQKGLNASIFFFKKDFSAREKLAQLVQQQPTTPLGRHRRITHPMLHRSRWNLNLPGNLWSRHTEGLSDGFELVAK